MVDSSVGLDYEAMFQHLKECEFEQYLCPFECDQSDGDRKTRSYRPQELEEHLNQCPLRTYKCPNCLIDFTRDNIDSHSCLSSLKQLHQSQSGEISGILQRHGIDYETLDPACSKGHRMQIAHGGSTTYEYGCYCDACGQNHLQMAVAYYHCRTCKYDLCRQCVYLKAAIFAPVNYFAVHECNLTKTPANRDSAWSCSTSNVGKC